MASEESIPTLKLLIIGPSNSGKSALLIRYCDDQFDAESITATIGVDFKIKKLMVHNHPYRLTLLDTAGQERFRTLSNSYYRGAHGIILCYDISDRDSFEKMDRWYEEIENNCGGDVVTFLVGCKLDVVDSTCTSFRNQSQSQIGSRSRSRSPGISNTNTETEEIIVGERGPKAVPHDEARKYAEEKGSIGFCEVSSKKGFNVKVPFVKVVEGVVSRPGLVGGKGMGFGGRGGRGSGSVVIDGGGGSGEEGCGC